MNKETVRSRIEQIGIIPAIRVSTQEDALFAAETVREGGIPIAEVTMTIPGAIGVIQELVQKYPELIVGAGTVIDVETAERCLDAGAHFLTSPGFDLGMVELALKRDVVVLPGALTPTEIMMASRAGSDFVKVFPCAPLGGASYIKALKTSFPAVPLIAAGGVSQQTAIDFLVAGSTALGIGRDLFPKDAVERRDAGWIHELARRFLEIVKDARTPMAA